MKRILIFFIVFILSVIKTFATPVLIFQKDGKIDVFNSDDIMRIEVADSLNDPSDFTPRCHNIYLKDSVATFPVEEVDSVVFGAGSSIIPKSDVRRISEKDLDYIMSYNGTTINYSKLSPKSIIPENGEKIFHDGFCDKFPFGICAQVNSVTEKSDCISIDITEIAPSEVFDEYYVAGDFEINVPQEAITRDGVISAYAVDEGLPFKLDPYSDDIFEIVPEGRIVVRFENFVGSPIRGYYHCDIYIGYEFDLDFNINSEDSNSIRLTTPGLTVFRTIIAGILSPRIDLKGFLDLNAQCRLNFNMHRGVVNHYIWTREDSKNFFTLVDETEEPNDSNEAKIDLVLEGSVHLGLESDLTLNTLFDRVGVGAKAKIGPSLKSEFGIGAINDLTKDFNLDVFARAKFEMSLLTKVETFFYTHDLYNNYEEQYLPFTLESELFKKEINLLPDISTKSVKTNRSINEYLPSANEPAADIASESNSEIIRELELGFQLVDENTDIAIKEEFLQEKYLANNSATQTFTSLLSLPSKSIEDIKVYPIVKYADKTIKLQPTDILEGYAISPLYYNGICNGVNFVGGAPIIGTHLIEPTLYVVGNNMPIPVLHSNFKKWRSFSTIDFIEKEDGKPSGNPASIFGKWKADVNEMSIEMDLKEDFTCIYNNHNGTYAINNPQAGVLKLSFEENKQLIISIVDLNLTEMTVTFQGSDKEIKFKRS